MCGCNFLHVLCPVPQMKTCCKVVGEKKYTRFSSEIQYTTHETNKQTNYFSRILTIPEYMYHKTQEIISKPKKCLN